MQEHERTGTAGYNPKEKKNGGDETNYMQMQRMKQIYQ
jgi:hypothetical protein